MTSKLTRERIELIANFHRAMALPPSHAEIEELARMALAAMDSEPVAYTEKHEISNMHATGLYLRAWPADRARNAVEGYTIPLYRHPQPASVVPESISVRQAISALESADAVTTIGQAYKLGWNACRAAMLAATPQLPGSEPATVPGKWIPVSEQMPEREVDVQVYCPDKKEQMVAYLERNELEGYFRFATWRTGDGIYCQPTHWMQLPAGPREVKGE